jgi:hypothetical protein
MSDSTEVREIAGFYYLRVIAVFAGIWIHGCGTNLLGRQAQWLTAFAVTTFFFPLLTCNLIAKNKQLRFLVV